MKTKFSLRKTKYGLPLIMLPFIILSAYVLSLLFPDHDDMSVAESVKIEGINSNLPDPSLSEQKDKFTLLQELLKNRRKESGLEDIQKELDAITSEQENQLMKDLENLIDPVSDTLKVDESQIKADSESALRELQKRYFPNETDIFSTDFDQEKSPKSQQADELALIRQQLARIDSTLKAQSQNKSTYAKEDNQNDDPEILGARKADASPFNTFNTLSGDKKKSFITAILDEAQSVVDGSRIRIRLLDDIFIGDFLFPKGSYLFGLVSGFSAQRVHVNISSVLYGDRILKTKLTIYDTDGIKGLYVPNSDFREMMRQAGSQMIGSNTVSINSNQNMAQQMAAQAGSDFYRSVTRAVSQKIRQNKARIKYASHIYLINEEAKHNERASN